MDRFEHICEFCETEFVVDAEDEYDLVQFCPFCGEGISSTAEDLDSDWESWDEDED